MNSWGERPLVNKEILLKKVINSSSRAPSAILFSTALLASLKKNEVDVDFYEA